MFVSIAIIISTDVVAAIGGSQVSNDEMIFIGCMF